MNSRGFTLVELVVVIAVMAILLGVATLNFNAYQRKANIDQQTKALYSTIITTRLTAMQRKQRSILFIGPNNYVYRSYSSSYEPRSAGLLKGRSTYHYQVQKKTAATLPYSTLDITNLGTTTDYIEFDARGFTSNNMTAYPDLTLVVTPVINSGASDCIVVQTARTIIGRMENVSSCRIR